METHNIGQPDGVVDGNKWMEWDPRPSRMRTIAFADPPRTGGSMDCHLLSAEHVHVHSRKPKREHANRASNWRARKGGSNGALHASNNERWLHLRVVPGPKRG